MIVNKRNTHRNIPKWSQRFLVFQLYHTSRNVDRLEDYVHGRKYQSTRYHHCLQIAILLYLNMHKPLIKNNPSSGFVIKWYWSSCSQPVCTYVQTLRFHKISYMVFYLLNQCHLPTTGKNIFMEHDKGIENLNMFVEGSRSAGEHNTLT